MHAVPVPATSNLNVNLNAVPAPGSGAGTARADATRATHVETVSAGVVCMAKTPPFFLVLLAVKLHGAGSLNFTVPLVHDL